MHTSTSISQSYENRLRLLLEKVERPEEGFFGPGSATWEVYRDPIMGLGGLRALLLQIAHPAVAQGVHRYSNFKTDTFGRARRTFMAMTKLIFGDCETALKSARKMYRIHCHIKGNTNRGAFKATDPQLLLWIQATLVDTAFCVFQTAGRPLSPERARQFYEESKIMATLMGIPEDVYPSDLDAFQTYFQQMIQGSELKVDHITLDLSDALFNIRFTFPPLNRLMAKALLPQEMNRRYRLVYTPLQRHCFAGLRGLTGLIIRLLPPPLRYGPGLRLAQYRIARYNGDRPSLTSRLYHMIFTRIESFSSTKTS